MMKINSYSKIFLFTFLLCAITFVPTISYAAEGGGIGIFPTYSDPEDKLTKGWFIYTLEPGAVKEDSLTLQNSTDKEMEVRLYPVDATTTVQGDFTLELEKETADTVGSWVKLSKSRVTLEPFETKKIPLVLTVPENAPVGDYAGGIIVQPVSSDTGTTREGFNVNIVRRVGARIYVTIPGEKVSDIRIGQPEKLIIEDELIYTVKVENKGNVIVNPSVKAEIRSVLGRKTITVDLEQIGDILPQTSRLAQVKTGMPLPLLGRHIVSFELGYADGKTASTSKSFDFVHFAIPIIGIGIIASILLWLWYLRRHRKRNQTQIVADRGQSTQLEADGIKEIAFVSHHVKAIGIGILVLIIILVTILTLILNRFFTEKSTTITSQSQTDPERLDNQIKLTPSVSPKPTINPQEALQKLDIKVLNGSGQSGAAAAFAEFLEEKNITVNEMANADSFSYDGILIQYHEENRQAVEVLKTEIKDYAKTIKLEATSTINKEELIIIVGK